MAVILERHDSLLIRAAVISTIRPIFILELINKKVINTWRAKCPPIDYN
jgi:hypothetical protein